MEHEAHVPEQSSLAIRAFGWVAGAVIVGGLAYYLFTISGLDSAANIANAYDNCKSGIMASMGSGSSKIQFLNTPENSKLVKTGDSYSMVMSMRLNDGTGPRDVNYSCAVGARTDWLAPIREFFR